MPQSSLPPLPQAFRAAVGLAAEAVEQARHLPDRAVELPMLAMSTALQLSMRAQQQFARLAAKGDEILSHRPATDEPPEWATFDDPPPGAHSAADDAPPRPSRFDVISGEDGDAAGSGAEPDDGSDGEDGD